MSRALLDAPDVARVVDRIAHQLLEKTGGAADTVLLGIPTRGVPLARRLAARIEAFEGVDGRRSASLDITLYRDDLRLRAVRPLEPHRRARPAGSTARLVVLVDDVLYSGRTVRAALDALRDLGRPRAVQLAVLVDRGHRRAADPGRLRRQEHPDLAGRRRVRVHAGRDRRRGRGRCSSSPRRGGSAAVKHLLSAGDLSRDEALTVLDTAERLDAALAGREVKKLPTLRGRTVVNLFFEDSTRTRISFELAAKRLSADVINFSAKGSSVSKGESLKDTALTLEAMGADAVVDPAPGVRRAAPAGHWVRGQRDQRRRRHARAPDPGAAGRVHHAAAARAASTGCGSRSSATCCTAGSPGPTCCCCHARGRGHAGRAADAAAGRASRPGRRGRPTTWTRRCPRPTW